MTGILKKHGFDSMKDLREFTEFFSNSNLIPKMYRRNPSNVFMAMEIAYAMNVSIPYAMNNISLICDKPTLSAQFLISLINKSDLFKGGLRYEITENKEPLRGGHKNLEATAYTIVRETGERISYTFTMQNAIDENYTKNIKYKNLPELMLQYRAAALLARTHTPELLHGFYMKEEMEDVELATQAVEQKPEVNKEGAKEDLTQELDKVFEEHEIEQEIKEDNTAVLTKLKDLIEKHKVSDSIIEKWYKKANVKNLEEMDVDKIQKCIYYLETQFIEKSSDAEYEINNEIKEEINDK